MGETTHIGIDVSKELLDMAIHPLGGKRQYTNDEEGIKKPILRLKELAVDLVVMEPTGGYEALAAATLTSEGILVAVVNARQIREYARVIGKLARTDRIDAVVMAEFVAVIKLPVRSFPDEETGEIKAMVSRRRQLLEMMTAEKNRKAIADESIRPGIQAHIDWLKKEVEDMDRDLRKKIEGSSAWRIKDNLLQSIPGIGNNKQPDANRTEHITNFINDKRNLSLSVVL